IGGLDIAVVDAEDQNEGDLGDEKKPEEEGEAAQRFLPEPLKRGVVKLIDQRAERIEGRQHGHAHRDRIDPEAGVDDIGEVAPEADEGGMRDVDEVENAERE